MINQAIGASGVASQECKAVVEQYGQTIIDLLVAEVTTWLLFIFNFYFFLFISAIYLSKKYFLSRNSAYEFVLYLS